MSWITLVQITALVDELVELGKLGLLLSDFWVLLGCVSDCGSLAVSSTSHFDVYHYCLDIIKSIFVEAHQ